MIYFDVTKTGRAAHRSGLTRVSSRLAGGLGALATPVRWEDWDRRLTAQDWFLTSELFSEEERPGFGDFLRTGAGRKAAIFHDAIPLKWPHITWPQSVARHPSYMKLLASFDRVWAVSAASRDELQGFWRWQGIDKMPPVEVLALGADFEGTPRVVTAGTATTPPSVISVGILEPRKNQLLLLEASDALWNEGRSFQLHLVGRVNPHFGQPIVARINALKKTRTQLHYHEAADDTAVAKLYAGARASLFPTMAEGCGLPLLESLWRGVPCVCSDLPVLRENTSGGGCLPVATNDLAAWKEALRRMLTDDALQGRLAAEARSRALPTWAEAAQTLSSTLG